MKTQIENKKPYAFAESFDNARITKTREENKHELYVYGEKCLKQYEEAKRLALSSHR